MNTNWTIIASKNRWNEPAFAVVYDVNRVREGFESFDAARAWAVAAAKAAYAGGDEGVEVDDITSGEHRRIWPVAVAAPAPIGRTKRKQSR